MPDSCTSKSCRGHEVDIMHFSIGNAIPGRLYGGNHIDNAAGNGNDRLLCSTLLHDGRVLMYCMNRNLWLEYFFI
jgi:hypothetical protein